MSERDTRNVLAGSATNVVQAAEISGGVHVHQNTPALPVPRQLPPDVAFFTNREPYMALLHAWLDAPHQGAAAAQVIAGVGGVGKTSLAAHWGHQVRHRFPDGDLYVDLRGYHVERSISATEALDQLLRAFNLPGERIPAGVDAKAALYRSMLHGRRMLIVLDNAATVDQIRPLLPGTPTCRVLVTSRSRLAGLTTREGAHRMALDVLSPDRAIDLLARIVDSERIDQDPGAAAELARRCGYLPLALRIAAERLIASDHLTVADVVDELAEERERLNVLTTDDDDFTTVRAVFSWSYRALPDDAARMFRLLGMTNGPDIGIPAAAALADLSPVKAHRLLDRLVGAYLLQENSPQRYRFHDLLRVYSAECAEADEPAADRQAALRRLCVWYLRSVEAAGRLIAPHLSLIPMELPEPVGTPLTLGDRPSALQWADSEHANLVATTGEAADIGEDTLAWQIPVMLFAYYLVRRPFTEWLTTHSIALTAAERVQDQAALVWLHTSLAIAYRELREYEKALAELRIALPGWREIGILWGEAWALRDAGKIQHNLGDIPEAVGLIKRALALHLAEGNTWGEAVARSMLAMIHHDLGQFSEALAELDRALVIYREHDDQRNVAATLSNLGMVYGARGDTDTAIEDLRAALAMHKAVDFAHGEALTHERLAVVFDGMGDPDTATVHWHDAVRIYDELGDSRADDIRSHIDA